MTKKNVFAGKDGREFRDFKVSFLEFKHLEIDRVLTSLFPRLIFGGRAGRVSGGKESWTIDDFLRECLSQPQWFDGFDACNGAARRWIETDLIDVVNRGGASQRVAAPRPLHGNAYKFRNREAGRDYGGSEQIYGMLAHARGGRGLAALGALRGFFFPPPEQGWGADAPAAAAGAGDPGLQPDVETQAILRWRGGAEDRQDAGDPPPNVAPMCVGQADLMADDILRLMAYAPHVSRPALIDRLKTLLAFHLSLYHLKLLAMLPKMVGQGFCDKTCRKPLCPVSLGAAEPFAGCPYRLGLVVDMGGDGKSHMGRMAAASAERFYRRIPPFVQALFAFKKLDEMAEEYGPVERKLPKPDAESSALDGPLFLLKPRFDQDRENYFQTRLLKARTDADVDQETQTAEALGSNAFESFIEFIMGVRGNYQRDYVSQTLDSLMLKNKENGMLAQPHKGDRRFVLGSKLLETLILLALLRQRDGRFESREIRIEQLLDFLRLRYGIFIDRLPPGEAQSASVLDRQALRLNLEAFKLRLRETGFYGELSDAYVTQKISPRYAVGHDLKRSSGQAAGGRGA